MPIEFVSALPLFSAPTVLKVANIQFLKLFPTQLTKRVRVTVRKSLLHVFLIILLKYRTSVEVFPLTIITVKNAITGNWFSAICTQVVSTIPMTVVVTNIPLVLTDLACVLHSTLPNIWRRKFTRAVSVMS